MDNIIRKNLMKIIKEYKKIKHLSGYSKESKDEIIKKLLKVIIIRDNKLISPETQIIPDIKEYEKVETKQKSKVKKPKEEKPKEENPKEEKPKEENPKEEKPKEEKSKEKLISELEQINNLTVDQLNEFTKEEKEDLINYEFYKEDKDILKSDYIFKLLSNYANSRHNLGLKRINNNLPNHSNKINESIDTNKTLYNKVIKQNQIYNNNYNNLSIKEKNKLFYNLLDIIKESYENQYYNLYKFLDYEKIPRYLRYKLKTETERNKLLFNEKNNEEKEQKKKEEIIKEEKIKEDPILSEIEREKINILLDKLEEDKIKMEKLLNSVLKDKFKTLKSLVSKIDLEAVANNETYKSIVKEISNFIINNDFERFRKTINKYESINNQILYWNFKLSLYKKQESKKKEETEIRQEKKENFLERVAPKKEKKRNKITLNEILDESNYKIKGKINLKDPDDTTLIIKDDGTVGILEDEPLTKKSKKQPIVKLNLDLLNLLDDVFNLNNRSPYKFAYAKDKTIDKIYSYYLNAFNNKLVTEKRDKNHFEDLINSINSNVNDYYPTPRKLFFNNEIIDIIKNSSNILEPTAGLGHIINSIRDINPVAKITANELNETFYNVLKDFNPDITVLNKNFLEYDFKDPKFDLIIINPPFTNSRYEGYKVFKNVRFYIDFLFKCLYILNNTKGVYMPSILFISPDIAKKLDGNNLQENDEFEISNIFKFMDNTLIKRILESYNININDKIIKYIRGEDIDLNDLDLDIVENIDKLFGFFKGKLLIKGFSGFGGTNASANIYLISGYTNK